MIGLSQRKVVLEVLYNKEESRGATENQKMELLMMSPLEGDYGNRRETQIVGTQERQASNTI